MASEDDDRGRAMVEFLRTFPTISTPPDALADLHDGVALFEALSEMYVAGFWRRMLLVCWYW